jgi:hypothetical protein
MRDKTDRSLDKKLKPLQSIHGPDFDAAYQSVIDTMSTAELIRLMDRLGVWEDDE